jgi:hypothetical protein
MIFALDCAVFYILKIKGKLLKYVIPDTNFVSQNQKFSVEIQMGDKKAGKS